MNPVMSPRPLCTSRLTASRTDAPISSHPPGTLPLPATGALGAEGDRDGRR
jgi:hypothetical protein